MQTTLRIARLIQGFEVQDVAKRIKMPVGMLESWEEGKSSPDAKTAERLCKLYDTSLQSIRWGSPQLLNQRLGL